MDRAAKLEVRSARRVEGLRIWPMCRDDWRNVPFYEASRTRTYEKTNQKKKKKTGNEGSARIREERKRRRRGGGKTMAAPLPVII